MRQSGQGQWEGVGDLAELGEPQDCDSGLTEVTDRVSLMLIVLSLS